MGVIEIDSKSIAPIGLDCIDELFKPDWMKGITGENFNPANGLPIVLYNIDSNSKTVIAYEDYNLADYPKSSYIPIGVVVIPKYHTYEIYPEGDPAKGKDVMCSLQLMSCNDPETGTNETAIMKWGANTDIVELQKCDITHQKIKGDYLVTFLFSREI